VCVYVCMCTCDVCVYSNNEKHTGNEEKEMGEEKGERFSSI